MKKIIQTEVVTFDELTPQQQAKVLDNLRDINTDFEWWESSYDFYKILLGYMGFEGVEISFSGFSSQGDGASFTADRYSYAKDAVKKIREASPTDTAFTQCAKEIQHRYFYGITGIVCRKSTMYAHQNTVEAEIFNSKGEWIGQKPEQEFNTIIRRLMKHIYRQLEEEYDDLTSDEQVKEAIEANEYFFNPVTLEIA